MLIHLHYIYYIFLSMYKRIYLPHYIYKMWYNCSENVYAAGILETSCNEDVSKRFHFYTKWHACLVRITNILSADSYSVVMFSSILVYWLLIFTARHIVCILKGFHRLVNLKCHTCMFFLNRVVVLRTSDIHLTYCITLVLIKAFIFKPVDHATQVTAKDFA